MKNWEERIIERVTGEDYYIDRILIAVANKLKGHAVDLNDLIVELQEKAHVEESQKPEPEGLDGDSEVV